MPRPAGQVGGSVPRSVVGLLFAAAAALPTFASHLHGLLAWMAIAAGPIAAGLGGGLTAPVIKKILVNPRAFRGI